MENNNTPNLDAVGKHSPFEVPSGYFEAINQKILAQTAEKPVARKIVMPQWIYWAAASVVAVAIALSSLIFLQQNTENPVQREDFYEQFLSENTSEYLMLEHLLANE